jgi:hypothetical protein
MDDVLWPLRGVLLFLRSPRWWIRPMLGMLLALAAFVGIGLGTAWSTWPAVEITGMWWWVRALAAVGLGVAAVVVAWVLLLPLLMSFLLEDLARKANAYAKTQVGPALPMAADRDASHELALVPGILASLKVLSWTMPTRLAWMGGSFVTGLLVAPLGVVISALGMGHVACIDAVDIALSLRGFDGKHRLAALKAHRHEIRQAALTAGLLHLALVATVIGWLVWLPGVVVGAALRTRTWSDTRGDAAASPPVPSPAPSPLSGGGASL